MRFVIPLAGQHCHQIKRRENAWSNRCIHSPAGDRPVTGTPSSSQPAAIARALSWLTIVLMLVAAGYALWMVALNWSHIGV